MGAAIAGFALLIVVSTILALIEPPGSCGRRMYLIVAVVTVSGLLVFLLLH